MEHVVKKQVCFFGIYNPKYARTRILMEGFRQNGFEVIECHVNPSAFGRIKKYWELFKRARHIKKTYTFDYVIVEFPGYTVVWLGFLVFGRRIIFDAFVSLFSANVYDRDLYSVHLASIVLVHTEELRTFFHRRFGISKEKIINIYIGANEEVFYPREQKSARDEVVVHFHGGFTKVQGLPYLIEAANILKDENIIFQLIGGGVDYNEIESLITKYNLEKKVSLVGRVPLEQVPSYIENADICIGILGDTPNSDLMVPNKVFEYLAMKKAIVTADTPAIQEVFEHGKTAQLCTKADPASIAEAIRELLHSPSLRKSLEDKSYEMYRSRFTAATLIKSALKTLEEKRVSHSSSTI